MSSAAISSFPGRSWWSRSRPSEKRDQRRPSLPVSQLLPSPSTTVPPSSSASTSQVSVNSSPSSKLAVFASAINFVSRRPKSARTDPSIDLHGKTVGFTSSRPRTAPKDSRESFSILSGPKTLSDAKTLSMSSSEGPLTPISAPYDPFASNPPNFFPSSPTTIPPQSPRQLRQPSRARSRTVHLPPSPRSNNIPSFSQLPPPPPPLFIPENRVLLSKPELVRKASSLSQPDTVSARQRLPRSVQGRIPLPKAPPELGLPPTPGKSIATGKGNLDSMSTVQLFGDRVGAMDQKGPKIITAHTTSPNSDENHTLLDVNIEKELGSQLAFWARIADDEEFSNMENYVHQSSPIRSRVLSNASVISSSSHDESTTPKKQRSLHNLKSSSSLLRHRSSNTKLSIPHDLSDFNEHPSGDVEVQAASGNKVSNLSRRRLFPSKKDAIGDGIAQSGIPSNNQRSPTLSLASSFGLNSSKKRTIPPTPDVPISPLSLNRPMSPQSRFIMPPEEVMRLMNEPIIKPKRVVPAMPEQVASRISLPEGARPTRCISLQSSVSPTPPARSLRPSTSQTSDNFGLTALRPRPRNATELSHRNRFKVSKGTSPTASSPNLERKNPSKSSLRDSRSTQNRLHTSASFLTLDDDEDAKSKMLTEEPVGPSSGWESDDPEMTSFFDFERGVNSMDTDEIFEI